LFPLIFILVSRPLVPWLWPAIGVGAGVYFFYHGFRLLQRKRLIMDTPASKVRSAAMGLVEISGQATGPYSLTAPITGAPCYYYRTIAWEWKQQGKSAGWVKSADESMLVPFYLDDNTGRVLVDPQGAEMEIHRDFHDEFSQSLFSSSLEVPANIGNFLLMHGVNCEKKVKVEEYCIKPKNSLFILGTLAHNPGITASAVPVRSVPSAVAHARHSFGTVGGLTNILTFSASSNVTTASSVNYGVSEHSTQPHLLDSTQQARIAAALTKAGITNPAAWAAAGINPTPAIAATNNTAAAAAPALEQFDLRPPTVLMKGAHNPAFFISWRSQREVVQSLGWKSALMIWGGPALTLMCTYILAGEFGWL